MHSYEITIYGTALIACGLLLLIIGLFVWSVARSKSQLLRRTQESYRAELELLEARNRLAADLHDEVGPLLQQSLSLVRSLRTSLPEPSPNLDLLSGHLYQIADCTRRVANNLLPPSLFFKGIGGAIEELLLECRAFHSFETKASVSIQDEPSVSTAMHLYRMLQELVNNSVKHSGGRLLQLELRQKKRLVSFCFQDDGTGFDAQKAGATSIGLRSLQLRAVLLGGQLRLLSNSNGTLYSLQIPLSVWKKSV